MSITHEINIFESNAKKLLSGDISYDIRKNSRDYQKGDFVRYSVINSAEEVLLSPLSKKLFEIKNVRSGYGIISGFVILSLAEVDG